MKTLLIIFIMGSEVRQFVHSGLVSKFLKAGWKIIVMSKVINDDLYDQIPAEVEIVPLMSVRNTILLNSLTRILDRAFNMKRARQGESTWQYGKATYKNWREALLSKIIQILGLLISYSEFLYNLVERAEKRCLRSTDYRIWKNFFIEKQVDAILVNVPKQSYWDSMLSAADESGIKSFLIYHTMKDIVANGRLNHLFTGIGVWNSEMKRDLIRLNPWINSETIKVVGCGHFDCVGRKDWLLSEENFRKEIGADPASLLIIYLTAGPGIVPEEERYIDLVVEVVRKVEQAMGTKIQIVFRMNPMDNRDTLYSYLKATYPRYIVLRPDWQDNRKLNWTYARKSDPVLYNALLHYASLCITIPSTVTVDCAIAGTPVINLGIEMPGEQPLAGSIRSFWEVDFNRHVRETNAARFVTNPEQLKSAIIAYLSNNSLDEESRVALVQKEIDGIAPGFSSDFSFELISSSFISS